MSILYYKIDNCDTEQRIYESANFVYIFYNTTTSEINAVHNHYYYIIMLLIISIGFIPDV